MNEKDTCTDWGAGFIFGAIVGLAIGFLYAPKPGTETRALFAGFIFGAIVGLAIGFLYAPKPGTETRALLMEKAEKAAEKAKEAAEKAKEATIAAEKRIEEKLHRKEEEA
jgi:gas vesicle protein